MDKFNDDTRCVMKGKTAMELNVLPCRMTVCKVADLTDVHTDGEIFFIGKTDEEVSLVCKTEDAPQNTIAREDGWRCFRIAGTLDFSLTGILAGIADILAEHSIGLFAVSTFNTDYIFVKEENFRTALELLRQAGYPVNDGH